MAKHRPPSSPTSNPPSSSSSKKSKSSKQKTHKQRLRHTNLQARAATIADRTAHKTRAAVRKHDDRRRQRRGRGGRDWDDVNADLMALAVLLPMTTAAGTGGRGIIQNEDVGRGMDVEQEQEEKEKEEDDALGMEALEVSERPERVPEGLEGGGIMPTPANARDEGGIQDADANNANANNAYNSNANSANANKDEEEGILGVGEIS